MRMVRNEQPCLPPGAAVQATRCDVLMSVARSHMTYCSHKLKQNCSAPTLKRGGSPAQSGSRSLRIRPAVRMIRLLTTSYLCSGARRRPGEI